MRLTHRDATDALSRLSADPEHDPGAAPAAWIVDTMAAVAEAVYPAEVTVTDAFVDTYVRGRRRSDLHVSQRREALTVLDDRADHDHGAPFADLSVGRRRDVLYSLGVDDARANPEGAVAERIRHYVVRELLFALYVSPAGADLIGAGAGSTPGTAAATHGGRADRDGRAE